MNFDVARQITENHCLLRLQVRFPQEQFAEVVAQAFPTAPDAAP